MAYFFYILGVGILPKCVEKISNENYFYRPFIFKIRQNYLFKR